jgi:DNA-binding transcriptional regulator YiaG
MSASGLRSWLLRHNLVQSDLAVICGVSERCVRFWVAGERPLPAYLRLLMRAVDDNKIDLPWLAMVVGEETEAA